MHHLDKNLIDADHAKLIPRAFLNGFRAVPQVGNFGGQLRVPGHEVGIVTALLRQPIFQLAHAQPPALAQPERPLDSDNEHGEQARNNAGHGTIDSDAQRVPRGGRNVAASFDGLCVALRLPGQLLPSHPVRRGDQGSP